MYYSMNFNSFYFSNESSFLPLHFSKCHEIEESFGNICVNYCIQTRSNYTDDCCANTQNGTISIRSPYVTDPRFVYIGIR